MECRRHCSFTEEVLDLYMSSFDDREKVPIRNIERTFGHGGELMTFHDKGRFVALAFHFSHDDMIFLVYLAVCPELRSGGYGSRIIGMMRDIFPDRRIFLPVEPLDDDAPDSELRRRRQAFYIRNGCRDSGFTVISDDYPFEIFFLNGSVSEDEANSTIGLYERTHNDG